MSVKHEYRGAGSNRRLVVFLPDGKEITVNDLMDQCGVKHNSAHRRLKRYIETGNLKKLLQPVQKIGENPLSETHYEAGDVRMYKDEEWIKIMKALTNKDY